MIEVQNLEKAPLDARAKDVQKLKKTLEENDQIYVTFISTPHCGKTSLFKYLFPKLNETEPSALIVCDPNSFEETKKFPTDETEIIHLMLFQKDPKNNSFSYPAPNRNLLEDSSTRFLNAVDIFNLLEQKPLEEKIIIAENNGDLDTPVANQSGADIEILLYSVADGNEQYKSYPSRIQQADIIVLTKADLASLYGFDIHRFNRFMSTSNPNAIVLAIDCHNREDVESLAAAILEKREQVLKQRKESAKAKIQI